MEPCTRHTPEIRCNYSHTVLDDEQQNLLCNHRKKERVCAVCMKLVGVRYICFAFHTHRVVDIKARLPVEYAKPISLFQFSPCTQLNAL